MRWNCILIGALVAGCISTNVNDGGDEGGCGGEEGRPCNCQSAKFSTEKWGDVKVRIRGSDKLLITLPIKGGVMCDEDRSADTCKAKLVTGIVQRRTDLPNAPSDEIKPKEFMPTAPCGQESAQEFDYTAEYTATFSSPVPENLFGTVALGVELRDCGPIAKRAVIVRIDDGKLNFDKSDFDSDNEPNGSDDKPWDPGEQ